MRQCGIRTPAKDLINKMKNWRKFNARERWAREESCLPGPLPPGMRALCFPRAGSLSGCWRPALRRSSSVPVPCIYIQLLLWPQRGCWVWASCSVFCACSSLLTPAGPDLPPGGVAARGSGAPCLCPGAQEPRVCVPRLRLGSHSWSSSTQMVLRCSSTILSLRTRSSSSTLLHISASTVA